MSGGVIPGLGDANAVLGTLPARCKAAGKKAHLKVYRKLLGFKTLRGLSLFLDLGQPVESSAKHRIFFEVRLGRRIADCVLIVKTEDRGVCYIIELKTCMTQNVNIFSPIRQAQRLQGLAQLSDSVKFLRDALPSGPESWFIIPVLLFKSQGSFKTLHSETYQSSSQGARTSWERLTNFLFVREDDAVTGALRQNRRPRVVPDRNLLGPQVVKRHVRKRRPPQRGDAPGAPTARTQRGPRGTGGDCELSVQGAAPAGHDEARGVQ
ncbi:nuclear protein UL24 [Common bottlenose dolphin gammaherpesvirus 1 strain Sarasota]|uniref:Nuclear protein UL24 n=1 Tax=Common bottlenose dolphin gammaherpesvirus 1 strain Sarasota TaxID=2022783 RepID=A0A1Z1NEG5_9GAMA|nr:nuclear protein UL24 [Common bottlenose dolphin gammaherpesvirus 1 strain Sarasota]ARW78083.1 nuclear protein UL24 [Common bottlenose dolphin gammaherpesvirus 1 strain Sarasota]